MKRREKRARKNEKTKNKQQQKWRNWVESSYLGNAWRDLVKICGTDGGGYFHSKVLYEYHEVTYAWKLNHCSSCQCTHGCGALASWAARHTTMCLDVGKMRTVLSSWLLLMAFVTVSIQQCAIEKSWSKIRSKLSSTSATMITINNTYYNCLSRSDTSDHYSSMSVSILYIRSHDPNTIHEVRYNLQCNNSVWEIIGNQSKALRSNNIVFCEDCTDQTVNMYHCTHCLGKDKVE